GPRRLCVTCHSGPLRSRMGRIEQFFLARLLAGTHPPRNLHRITVMENSSDRSRAHVLVLPGGSPVGTTPARAWHPAQMRMRLFTESLRTRLLRHGISVELVSYRYRGWNGDHMSPVRDGLAAIDDVVRRRGDVRLGLVGHSMGGRVA